MGYNSPIDMIFECAYCESKVDGKIVGEHEFYNGEEPPSKVTLLDCPVCHNPGLTIQEIWEGFNPQGEHVTDWDDPVRVWPNTEVIDWRFPAEVKISLEEAKRCFKAKAYNACAVMCGRTLESACAEFGMEGKMLAGGLKKLLDKEIIDKKIYLWGEELRKRRNIGAHAAKERVNKADAEDILDFTNVICQYIFVLSKQFDNFIKRKGVNRVIKSS